MIFFKDFAVARHSLQFFEDWANTYSAKHLLMTGPACSWFINVRTAVILEQTNTLRQNEKANSSNRWKPIKSMQMLNTV